MTTPFQEFHEILTDIANAAQTLMNNAHGNLDRTDRDFWRQMEGNIWAGAVKPDPIAERVNAAIAKIEAICHPTIGGKARELGIFSPRESEMKIVAIAACVGIMSTGVQAEEKMIPKYRTTHGVRLVCYAPYGANWDPCSRMPLSLVKKIDVMAEDICDQGPDEMGPPTIPHAIYGDAGALNYRCIGRHMKREPYAYHFDYDGYQNGNWKPVR